MKRLSPKKRHKANFSGSLTVKERGSFRCWGSVKSCKRWTRTSQIQSWTTSLPRWAACNFWFSLFLLIQVGHLFHMIQPFHLSHLFLLIHMANLLTWPETCSDWRWWLGYNRLWRVCQDNELITTFYTCPSLLYTHIHILDCIFWEDICKTLATKNLSEIMGPDIY